MSTDAVPITSSLELADMPAVHAVRAVEFALSAIEGVDDVAVTRATATVRHQAAVTDRALIDAVSLVGARVVRIVRERRLPVIHGSE